MTKKIKKAKINEPSPGVTTFFVKLPRPEEMKGQHQAEATKML